MEKIQPKTVHECVTCVQMKPKRFEQIMSDLLPERVQPNRLFINTGVDYCGPVYIRPSNKRSVTSVKAYIAVFICFSTKATHLKLVSNLLTDAFLGALKWFMACRGKVSQIFTDNATNFVGATNELEELSRLFKSDEHLKRVEECLAQDNIRWHFITPRSPHFGGL
ncbi:uncharacterized protein LOC142324154 [Lycorma delicatula]|uniref:uncharacterized protein LOC142324154 n=1 Tax=Lycorma delicatula TaxID=130591 RepID=UPI003F5186C8